MKIISLKAALLILTFICSVLSYAQSGDRSFVDVTSTYSVIPNLTYQRAGGVDLKLDVYRPRNVNGPNPTLMYIHGGGWTNGSKEGSSLTFLPYLEMGWTVVNVAYRLADVAHAPAAVEDTRCALRWIYRNAERYGFDKENIVVTGNSAGGHLALTTGMFTSDVGMERQCPGDRMRSTWDIGPTNMEPLEVAAIVNWYGITSLSDLLNNGPGTSGNFTEAWIGSSSNRIATAARVSPLNHVRDDLPPIITIHGNEDSIVPFSHGMRLHEALDRAEVPNQLLTIEGGGHGGFSAEQMADIYREIRAFLQEHSIGN
ncbi:MAG: alpha/beta hydrolase fold domain-containing protein [Pseudomonadales bacterium]|nr:alpha/beta hydrolase fold domain-containing protein [Pseudomonadales bacterium]